MTWFVLVALAILAVLLVCLPTGAITKTTDGPLAAITTCFIVVLMAIIAVLCI
jgi:hypothetical protein